MNYLIQLTVALLLGSLALFIFRLVSLDYQNLGRLSLFSTILEFVIFGLHGCSSYIFLDSRLSNIRIANPLFVIAIIFMGGGLIFVLLAMSRLGWSESIGQRTSGLRQSGLYRYTRNPQIVSYLFFILGYALLWPAWSGIIWLGVYLFIANVMVRTEEAHLARLYGEEYAHYCIRTPRYIGVPKKP